MENRNFKQFLYLGIIFSLWGCNPLPNNLNIDPVAQKTKNWCWAASMEMVTKYHGGTDEQCSFAQTYYTILNGKITSFPPNSCYNICDVTCDNSTDHCSEYDESIQSFDGTNQQYFDMIFSQHGYNSIEDNVQMSWTEVKNQINTCRPFILALLRDLGVTNLNIHAVVAAGYKEIGNDKWLFIIDPWRPCEGCFEFLPFPVKIYSEVAPNPDGTLGGITDGVSSFIHDIHPRSQTTCTSCAVNQPPNLPRTDSLFALAQPIIEQIGKGNNPNLLKQWQDKNEYIITPVQNLSFPKLLKDETINNLKNAAENQELYDIKQKQVTVQIQNYKSIWHTTHIIYCDYYENNVNVLVNNRPVNLNNIKQSNSIPYEYIDYAYLFYGFYRFNLNGVWYMSPVKSYNDLKIQGSSVKQGIGYLEKDMIIELQRRTKEYYKTTIARRINGANSTGIKKQ